MHPWIPPRFERITTHLEFMDPKVPLFTVSVKAMPTKLTLDPVSHPGGPADSGVLRELLMFQKVVKEAARAPQAV